MKEKNKYKNINRSTHIAYLISVLLVQVSDSAVQHWLSVGYTELLRQYRSKSITGVTLVPCSSTGYVFVCDSHTVCMDCIVYLYM